MYFHDPLPSDVRRKNYIPLFPDFRQNPLNSKSPSERKKKKKKKIQSGSVQLDLMRSRTTTSLFFFFCFFTNQALSKARGSHFLLGLSAVHTCRQPNSSQWISNAQFRFFFLFFFFFLPSPLKHTRSGSLRSGSAAGHPEAERSKGH